MDHTVVVSGTPSGAHGSRGRALRVLGAGLLAWGLLAAGAILTNRDGAGAGGGGTAAQGVGATATVSGTVITLAGSVPDEAVRTAIVAAANIAYGAGNVVDRITVAPAETAPTWSKGFPALILTLKPIQKAKASASGDVIVLSGVAADAADRDRAVGTAKVIVGRGGTVRDRIVVRPPASTSATTAQVRKLQTAVGAILRSAPLRFSGREAGLSAAARSTLDRVALVLRRARGVEVELAAHTDARGTAAANLALSKRRATAAAAYLERKGVSAAILRARGYGESVPLQPNRTAAGRAENRRIEISVRKG